MSKHKQYHKMIAARIVSLSFFVLLKLKHYRHYKMTVINTPSSCVTCEELQKYKATKGMKCSKCTMNNCPDDYTQPSKTFNKVISGICNITVNVTKDYPRCGILKCLNTSRINLVLAKKIENMQQKKLTLDFDIYVSCRIIEMYDCSVTSENAEVQIKVLLTFDNRKTLKETYGVDDDIIDKLSTFVDCLAGRRINTLIRNDHGINALIGNTIAEYVKYKSVLFFAIITKLNQPYRYKY